MRISTIPLPMNGIYEKADAQPPKPLYIVLISVHGLIRGHELELGRDADTGGQTKYVVELARALGERADVEKVVLLTRRVIDSQVSPDYAEPLERLSEKVSIVHIECGEQKYLRKEMPWDSLENFSDNSLPCLLSQESEIETTCNISRRIEAEETTLGVAERVITSTQQEIEQQYGLYDFYQPDRMRVVPPGTDLEKFFPPQGSEKKRYRQRTQALPETTQQSDHPGSVAPRPKEEHRCIDRSLR